MNVSVEKIAFNPWFAIVGRTMMTLMVPAALYVSHSLIELQTEVRVIKVLIETQKATLDAQVADRYRASDALRDLKLLQIQIDEMQRRLGVVERQPAK